MTLKGISEKLAKTEPLVNTADYLGTLPRPPVPELSGLPRKTRGPPGRRIPRLGGDRHRSMISDIRGRSRVGV